MRAATPLEQSKLDFQMGGEILQWWLKGGILILVLAVIVFISSGNLD